MPLKISGQHYKTNIKSYVFRFNLINVQTLWNALYDEQGLRIFIYTSTYICEIYMTVKFNTIDGSEIQHY